jgi:hypothetical protein
MSALTFRKVYIKFASHQMIWGQFLTAILIIGAGFEPVTFASDE